jgi:predicted MFS family arabinose efflux permease
VTAAAAGQGDPPAGNRTGTARVIGGAALGTLFEWYDFYLYGALASTFAAHFFSVVGETTAFILALATFAVGFIVRPLGALVFGRLGDRVGRKVTFLVTLAIMGLATFLVGLLPGHAAIGIAAPLLLVALRIVQGLAIGGEFAGAIVYVAEHAPAGRRGLHTSCIPAMAIAGLLLALAVIAVTRSAMTPQEFSAWGWRLPFLLSAILLAVSLWVRFRLRESPVFRRMQEARTLSRAPVAETFVERGNLRLVLAALFGAVVGQAVLFYVGTFYAYYFLERVARLDGLTVTVLTGSALAIATPLVIACGWLADRVGRKPLLLGAVTLAALLYFPLFGALLGAANPALAQARAAAPVIVRAHPPDCSLLFDPLARARHDENSCDVVTSELARSGTGYAMAPLPAPGAASLEVGNGTIHAPDAQALAGADRAAAVAAFRTEARKMLASAGYATVADPGRVDRPRVIAILVALLAFAALASGAYAALLVEMFPARIRYTALSFPQNFGNGWFGGLLPAIAFSIVAATGNVFAGLWYPVIVAALCGVVCYFAVPETRGRSIH